MTVRASDDGNRTRSHPVTITLTNVDEGPLISGPAEVTLNEVINPTPGQVVEVGSYTRPDPEGAATNWAAVGQAAALTGADADKFEFHKSDGRLTFAAPPDYEDGGASYDVTLNANDGTLNSTLDITVNVANLEEPGTLTLDRRRPIINRPLVAALADGDGVTSATWQWQRSTSRTSGFTDISGGTSSSYTPVGDDRDHYLRANVEYTDGFDTGNRLQVTSEFTAANDRTSNTPPVLPDSVDPISIPESTRAGRNVGSPVRASDAENDPLVYELSGSSDFAIHRTSAQIRVADGVTLDFDQGQTNYTLTVTADDGFGGTDTVDVTVNITGVNEPPDATDDAPSAFAEDTTVTIDVLANDTDPENDDLTVTSVSRPSSGSTTLNSDGTITYTPNANYSGSDRFTYRARDTGGLTSGVATVALTIRGVNDDPTFPAATAERSVSESAEEDDNVGAPVTATDIDGDDLTYSLSGTDAFAFDIDPDSGQITVAAGVTFDIATQDTYEVTITASDSGSPPLSASVDVTITVTTGPVGPVIIGGGGGGGGGSGPSPSTVDFEWTVKHDIEALDAANDAPTGMWSDGTTLWLVDNPDGAGDAVYAYDASTGERINDREFALDERNRAPRGIWSDGKGVVWVSDSGRDLLFAYDLAAGDPLEDRDIELAERNRDVRGFWSDEQTVWVLDGIKDSLFAYDLEGGELLAEYALDSRNSDPRGIWSDGVTIWISDHGLKELWAYRLPSVPDAAEPSDEKRALERVRDEDFTELSSASNNSPRGIWSDGDVMYVADASDGKVYTYNMPDAIDARLASLMLSGVDIGEFATGQTDYEGIIADGVAETTVVAEAVQRRTGVAITPPDGDEEAVGHQVVLAGVTEITIAVTSADGTRERTYRVVFEPTVTELSLSPTWTSFEWPGNDGVTVAEAGLPEEVIVVYTWDETTSSWLGYFPGLVDVPGLNTLTAFSSGVTYWVAAEEDVVWTVAGTKVDEE